MIYWRIKKELQQNKYHREIFKPGSSSSIWILSQETIAERIKLKSQERKRTGSGLTTLTQNRLLTTITKIVQNSNI